MTVWPAEIPRGTREDIVKINQQFYYLIFIPNTGIYKINFQIPYNSIVDLYTKFRSNSIHKQTHTTQHI